MPIGLLLCASAGAQTTLYWDANGTGSGVGGTGTWNTSSSLWRSGSISGTLVSWSNTAPTDYAVFQGTAGTVTVGAAITLRRITFGVNSYVIAGSSTLTFDADGIVDTGSFAATISARIAGSAGLVKQGSGTLTLSGANTYTGATNVGTLGGANAGTLALGANNVLPGTAVSIFAGTLNYNTRSDTIGALNLGGGAAGTTAAVTGTTGTLTLGGNVTYNATNNPNGATIAGKLALGSANRTFTIGDSTAAASDLSISAVISGTRALIKAGNGTLTLSGTNTYTGATTIAQGTLQLGANAPSGAAGSLGNATSNVTLNTSSTGASNTALLIGATGITVNRKIVVANQGTGVTTLGGNITSGSGTFGGTVTLNKAANFNADGTSTITFGGVVSGAGSLTKTGNGTVTLSGANTYSGSTNVGTLGGASAGTLMLGANNVLPGTAVSVFGGTLDYNSRTDTIGALNLGGGAAGSTAAVSGTTGTLTLGGNVTYNATNNPNGATISGNLALGSANRTFTVGDSAAAGSDLSVSAVISGTRALTKAGNGTLTLSGTNTYTGATTISAGTLQLGAGGTTGSVASTSIVNNGSLVFNRSNDFTYSGTISGSGTVVQNGPGAVTLSGNNSYTGTTTVNLGTLKLGSAGSAGNGPLGTTAAGTLVNSGGALDLNGFTLTNAEALSIQGSGVSSTGALTNSSATAASYAGAVTLANDSTVGGAGNITLTSGLSDNGTGRTLTKVGAGTLALNAAATLWSSGGNVVVNQGTFTVGATNALGSSATPSVTVNATAPGTTASFATNSSVAQTIQSLTFGGTGATGTSTNNVSIGSSSTLTLGGNVTYDATNNPFGATISGSGTLALGSSSRTFNVANSTNAATDLAVSANLSGSGALVKTGAGTLALSGTNTSFTGGVTINAGTLQASGSTVEGGFTALGNYSGLTSPTTVATVASGATLAVQSTATSGYGTTPATLQTLALNGTGDGGVGALRALGGINTWSGNISLGSDTLISNAGAAGSANVLYLAPWLFQQTSLHLDLNNHNLTLAGTGNIAIASMIGAAAGDTGSLTLIGGDDTTRYTFAGLKNYYTGDTILERGVLRLQVEPSGLDTGSEIIETINTAVRGDLVIGTGSSTSTARVELKYSDQIADTVDVTINSDGTLDLGAFGKADTIGHLLLNGGTVSTISDNQGILSLGGVASGADIDVATAATSTISGLLHLNNVGGATRTINVASGSTLDFSAGLYGGSFIKEGGGTMILSSDNAFGYSGTTEVRDGILRIRDDNALGQIANGTFEAAQTMVSNGATLELQPASGSITFPNEYLVLSGAGYNSVGALHNVSGGNSWAGRVTLADSASIKSDAGSTLTVFGSVVGTAAAATTQTLTVGGAGNTIITGAISNNGAGTLGLTKVDTGTLSLSGSNTFTGNVDIQGGTVALVANNTLGAQTNTVNVASSATLAVTGSGNTVRIGELTGTGLASLSAGTTLQVNTSGTNSFSGQLAGAGLFEKLGSGTFTFTSAANTGLFDFSGTVKLTAGTLEFQGGSLAESLSLGTLQLAGGTLFLNASTINVGTLNITGDTILDFGTGAASILNASNIYIAAGATLTVRNWSSEVDFLFANVSFYQDDSSGLLAIFNTTGAAPQNQVHFEGDPISADGSHTGWTNYYPGFEDHQVRPIPEPSVYGALLLGVSAGVFWLRQLRKRQHP